MASETETIAHQGVMKTHGILIRELLQECVKQILIVYATKTEVRKAQAFRKKDLLPAITMMANYLMNNIEIEFSDGL
jgi:hypothetical protein